MKRPAANRLFFGWVFVLVLVIMVVPFDLCDGSAVPEKNTYTVPTFRAQDLLQKRGGVGGTAAIRRELETILITTGLLAILVDDDTTDDTDTGIPTAATDPSTSGKDQPKTNRPYNPNKLQTARDLALEGLCHCWSTPPPTPSEDDVDEEKHDPPDTGDCFHLGRDSSASSSGGGGVDSALLSDGMTRRTTFATATLGHANPLSLPQPLPPPIRGEVEYDRSSSSSSSSMIPAMEILRDQVAYVSHLFVQALDDLSASPAAPNNPASRPVPHPEQENPRHVLLETVSGTQFRTWSSIVQASQNLEHFHLYERPAIPRNDTEGPYATHSTSNDPVTAAALEVHADAGLFLAFVPGRACDSSDRDDEEDHFYVQLPNPIRGEPPLLKRAVFPPGSIGIMLGAGAEHWVQRKRPSSHPTSDAWKATRHAVYMPPGHRRAWYGMMHMVPPDAIIQDFPRRTFADMRQSMVLTGKDARRTFGSSQGDKEPDQNVVIGCGQDYHSDNNGDDEDERTLFGAARIHRRRLAMVADASYCNNATNFFCWMSCLNIPNADSASKFVAEGQSLYCLDPAVLADSDLSTAVNKCNKNYHDDSCMGSWQPTGVGIPFQPVILPQENSSSSSALADAGKDVFCYGGTSMYMDGFHWTDTTCVIYLFNQWTLDSAGALVGACFGTIFFGIALEAVIWKRRSVVPSFPHGGWSRLIASTAFYGVQLTMGYLIMLVVMIYSAPLFVSVVVGLMMGHALFNAGGIMGSKRKEHNPTETNSNYVENGIPSRTCIRGDTVEEAMDNSSGGEDSKWGQRPCDSQTGCLPDKTNNNRNLSYQSTTSAWSTNHNNFNRTKDEAPEGITPCCQNTL